MKHTAKKCILLLAGLALAAVLSGCTFFDSSVEQLFTLPRMAEEYTGLSQQIDSLIDQGYEYASPSGGRNIQSVQMVDLEDDGIQEALVFLRRSSDEKPLKIMVFRLEGDTYRCFCTIESSGSAVDSVYYQDLNGDGCREIIVGWRISADVQTLAAYTVESEPVALMSSGYTQFSVQDLNGDGVPSLLVLRSDGELGPVAEFYGWQEEQMGVSYRCRLSTSMAALNRGSVVTGMVDKDTPAVFITGVDITSMAVTDILIYRQEAGLVNVALDKNSGVSAALTRTMISLRQRSTFFTAYLTSSRAASFSSGDTASSRSNMMASAPKKPQLVIIFGLFPGTKSMERLMRSLLPPVRARLPAGHAGSSRARRGRLRQSLPAARLRRAERCAPSARSQRRTAIGRSTRSAAQAFQRAAP